MCAHVPQCVSLGTGHRAEGPEDTGNSEQLTGWRDMGLVYMFTVRLHLAVCGRYAGEVAPS